MGWKYVKMDLRCTNNQVLAVGNDEIEDDDGISVIEQDTYENSAQALYQKHSTNGNIEKWDELIHNQYQQHVTKQTVLPKLIEIVQIIENQDIVVMLEMKHRQFSVHQLYELLKKQSFENVIDKLWFSQINLFRESLRRMTTASKQSKQNMFVIQNHHRFVYDNTTRKIKTPSNAIEWLLDDRIKQNLTGKLGAIVETDFYDHDLAQKAKDKNINLIIKQSLENKSKINQNMVQNVDYVLIEATNFDDYLNQKIEDENTEEDL